MLDMLVMYMFVFMSGSRTNFLTENKVYLILSLSMAKYLSAARVKGSTSQARTP